MEGWRRKAKDSLEAWCRYVLAPLDQEPQPHHLALIGELQAVAEAMDKGASDNLMVMMPPGSAKSTYVSKLLASWVLATRARRQIIGVSHTAELAEDFSANVRNILGEFGPPVSGVRPATMPARLWRTSEGGAYRAVGTGGAVTGFRSDLTIIDDPIKGDEAADSEVQREKVWNWYLRDLMTRSKPGGCKILVLTRWHEDDLAGRLLLHTPGDWRTFKVPAIAGEGDPLGRAPGDWLWDSDPTFNFGALLRQAKATLEATGATRAWSALYQQEPTAAEGLLFKVMQLRIVDAAPFIPWEAAPNAAPPPNLSGIPNLQPAAHGSGGIAGAVSSIVRAWDFAATAESAGRDPDWTVGVKVARLDTGSYVVLDVVRLRGGPEAVQAAVENTAAQDGPRVTIGLPQDPGQAGKMQVAYLARGLAGHRVVASPETGDKATRAAPAASQVNVGNVALVKGAWNRPFIEELRDFPNGRHDDQADAFSRAMAMLSTKPPPAKAARINFMGR